MRGSDSENPSATAPTERGLRALAILLLSLVATPYAIAADADSTRYDLNIARQPLDTALEDLAQQTGLQVGRFSDAVKGDVLVGPMAGRYSAEQALRALLAPSGLTYRTLNDRAIIVLRPEDVSVSGKGKAGGESRQSEDPKPGDRLRLAQTSRGATSSLVAVDSSSDPSSNAGGVFRTALDEIVVTAQKRAERAQSVAMSISAFSGERIDQLGLNSVYSLTSQIPNVSYTGEGSVDQFNIRGVQLNDFGDGNEPPVGVYVDDVYYGTLAGHQTQLFDTERVEVLRGPQGTLFGRNTVGGLVNTITRGPTRVFEGYGSVQVGSYGQRIFDGAISGPLSERLRARLALQSDQDDGWQRNEVISGVSRAARTNNYAGRLSAEYEATDNLQIRLNVHGLNQTSTPEMYEVLGTFVPGSAEAGHPIYCDPKSVRAGSCESISIFGPAAGTFISGPPDPRRAFTDLRDPRFDIHSYGGWVKVQAALGGVDLVSITSFDSLRKLYDNDPDGPRPEIHGDFRISARQWSQELRLAGQTRSFHWVGGLFYYKDRKFDWSFATPELVQIFGTTLFTQNQMNLDTVSYAAFAQGNYNVTDTVQLTAGGRWTHETKDLLITDSFSAPHYTDTENSRARKATWRAGVDWNPAQDALLYGNVATGFKSGAFNTQLVGPGGSVPSNPEEITTYEIGAKTEWLDKRLRINVAAFDNDYRNVQAAITTNVNDVPVVRNVNVGKLNTKGAELETVMLPSRGLELDLAAGWIAGKYQADDPTKLIGDRGIPLNGATPPHTPRFNLKMLGQYRFDLKDLGGLTVQVNATWEDKVFLNVVNDPYLTQNANWIWNTRLSWTSLSERYEVSAFVNNFTDTKSVSGGFMQGGLGLLSLEWKPPRLAGVKFTAKF